MSETKFTKGPWINNEQGFLIGKNGNPVKASGLGSIQSFNNCDEHKANSELMKCAPDMYKHIEEDIHILQRQAKQYVFGSHELRVINLRIETKQKLLKKVRGE